MSVLDRFFRFRKMQVMGWREWISLPELQVAFIKAKIDTGARTSVLHAEEIKIVRKNGARFVRFKIYPGQKTKTSAISLRAPLIEKRVIRSSTGHESKRPVIRTMVQLGQLKWPIEITLFDRDVMGFRMLVGRQAIATKFLVDPYHSYLLGKRPPRELEEELSTGHEVDLENEESFQ